MTTPDHKAEVYRDKDGHPWRIGGDAEIAWIRQHTERAADADLVGDPGGEPMGRRA
jgi:hypothetical protein